MLRYIHPQAALENYCTIGYFTVILEGVRIGEGSSIGSNVTIYPGTVLGPDCRIGDNCIIGKQPHPAKTSTVRAGEVLDPLKIGRGSILGSGVVLYAGTNLGEETMIGDLASVREKCRVGRGVTIGRGVVLEREVSVGDFVKIQTGAYLTSHTLVESNVFIAPMVCTANDNFMGRTGERFARKAGPRIERGARIGAGALILPGVTVAQETFVAAGSLVTRDTEPGTVVRGRPARVVGPVPLKEQL